MEEPVYILVVDDQPANLSAMNSLLSPLGESVLLASSGDLALKMLLEHDVAVILLDVNMPTMNGYETAQMIRAREASRGTPIIFMTARDDDPDEVLKGYKMGAVDFIFKPVISDEIVRYKASVFVDLYKARRRDQERELEAERRAVRELSSELEQYRAMGAAPALTVGTAIFGSLPIEKASKATFDELAVTYGRVLDQALESQALKTEHDIGAQLRELADALGLYRAGPRDVVELHTKVLATKTADLTAPKASALVAEGRFLALELMGHLVSYYRKYYAGPHLGAPAKSRGSVSSKSRGGIE